MYSSHQSNSEKESTSYTSSTRKQAHNRTGIPDQVKAKYEQHSGYSFDDVRIHYNSDMPAQFHAFAFTQGNNVYIGPQQEGYLNHELGHVVQQKQGRVSVESYYNGVAINKDSALEREADNFLSYAPVRRQGEIQDNNTFADNLTFSSNLGNNGGIYDSGIMQCKYFMRALPYEESFPVEVNALCSEDNWKKSNDEFISDIDLNNIARMLLAGENIFDDNSDYLTKFNEKQKNLKKNKDKNIYLFSYLDGLAGVATSIFVENGIYIYPVGYMLDITDKKSVYANYLIDSGTSKPGFNILGNNIFKSIIEQYLYSENLKGVFQENVSTFSAQGILDLFLNDHKINVVAGDFQTIIHDFLKDYKENKTLTDEVKKIVIDTINTHLASYYSPQEKPEEKNLGAGFGPYAYIADTVKTKLLKNSTDINSYSESVINANINNVCCVWYDDRNSEIYDGRPINPKWKVKLPSPAHERSKEEVFINRCQSASILAGLLSKGKKIDVVPLSKLKI